MTSQEPAKRPTAAEALSQFETIAVPLKGALLRWRLKRVESGVTEQAFENIGSVVREGVFRLRTGFGLFGSVGKWFGNTIFLIMF